jgi:RNA polymerase sigma factor (sigma-70 family)
MKLKDGITFHGQFAKEIEREGKAPKDADPLWESFRQGNGGALEKIFKTYYPVLLNYGLRLNTDEDEVKDCIQMLFLNIWERRSFLGTSDSARNYLLASLRRLIVKRMRAGLPFVELDQDNTIFHVELSVETKIINDQTLRENVQYLQAAIENLPERQKEALYLRFYNDQSFGDIATVMNISTRAVYKLIYKALDSLNEELAPQTGNVPFLIGTFLSLLYAAGKITSLEAVSLPGFFEIA